MNFYQRQLQRGAKREQQFNMRFRFAVIGGITLLFAIAAVWVMVVF